MRNACVVFGTIAALVLPGGTAQAVQLEFFDLGATNASPDISMDGTLVGAGGTMAVYGVPTPVSGGNVVGVEYLNGVPTAVGKTTSAAIWQAGAWTTLPLVDGTATWAPTGIGVGGGSTLYVSGYAGSGNSRSAIRYDSVSGQSTNIGVPTGPLGSDARATAVADTGAIGGAADSGGSSRNAFSGLPVSWLYTNASPGQGSSIESEVFDISSDGITKVGWGYAASGAWQAMYWNNSPNLIPLYLGIDWSEGHAVNGDGTMFGGFTYTDGYTTNTAWVWQTGWVNAKSVTQYLTELGVDTTGWKFTNVTGLSNDGTALVGTGTYDGQAHAWAYALTPEPASILLLALGGLFLRRR